MFLCGKWQADRLLIPTIGILKPLSRLYGVLPSDPNDTSADEGCPIVYPYATSKIITRNQRQTCFFWLEVWRVKLGRFHSGAFLSQCCHRGSTPRVYGFHALRFPTHFSAPIISCVSQPTSRWSSSSNLTGSLSHTVPRQSPHAEQQRSDIVQLFSSAGRVSATVLMNRGVLD